MTKQQDEKKMTAGSSIKVISFMWPYVWHKQTPYRKFQFLLSMLLVVATIFLNISVPFLLKQVVLVLTDKPDLSPLLGLTPIGVVLCYALFWGLARLTDRLRAAASFPMAIIAAQKFCLDLLAHLHQLSTRFHKDRKTGSILNIIDRSKMAFIDLIGHSILLLVPVVIEILLAVCILTYLYDFSFGLILLNLLVLYVLLSYYVSGWTAKCRKIQNKTDSSANAYIVDSLLNAETIKYFDTAGYEEGIAKDKLLQKEVADQNSLIADAQASLLQSTLVGITLFIMTFYAGYKVVQGSMGVEDFVLVNGYVLMFMFPLQMLGYHIRETRDNITVVENSIELFSEAIEIQEIPDARALQVSSGKIDFKNISFGYADNRLILKNVSFVVIPRTTTAVVGTSGSGKSTLSRLLFRLYDLNSGDILIDDQSVKSVTKDSLRDSIGIVPQDTILFNDTLYNNIVYGKPGCSDDELRIAIKKSHLEDLISKLPDGLNTRVGERGLKLSGGEKQRIAIARILLKMPSILVFDEATSALDMQTEKEIQVNLNEISKGTTTIIIAHRLSTIKHADNIVVLEHGEVVEVGNHQELMGKGGYYFKLWNKQMEGDNQWDFKISFRALKYDDLNLIHKWFKLPEINKWYARGKDWTRAEVEAKYIPRLKGHDDVPSFIIRENDNDIGFIQYYLLSEGSLPEGMRMTDVISMKVNINNSVGVDLFIGDENLLGIGLGSQILREFIKTIIPSKYTSIYIDPESSNIRAIKSYNKVGFKVSSQQTSNKVCLMLLERDAPK